MNRTPLSLHEIGPMVGLAPKSVSAYHSAASRRRAEGQEPLPSDMPAPDVLLGRSPGWYPETLQKWIEARAARAAEVAEQKKLPRGPRKGTKK